MRYAPYLTEDVAEADTLALIFNNGSGFFLNWIYLDLKPIIQYHRSKKMNLTFGKWDFTAYINRREYETILQSTP
jgi:hypothetical protein